MRPNIPPAPVGPTLGPWGLVLSPWGFALGMHVFLLGPQGFQISKCWHQQRELLALRAGPNAKPQHEWFSVAVEYRLKITFCNNYYTLGILLKMLVPICQITNYKEW